MSTTQNRSVRRPLISSSTRGIRHVPLCEVSVAEEEKAFLVDALASGDVSEGRYNRLFEDGMLQLLDVPYGTATSSCYGALHSVIKCLGITGDVIVPSFTFAASANAIVQAGANPVFADVRYETRNITAENILAAYTPNTEAIMVVHFAGQVCEMEEIDRVARTRGVYLIEDSAQTVGARCGGRQAGTFGIGCFSFFATKNMTTGEGGFVALRDADLHRAIRLLIGHGIKRDATRQWHREAVMPGMNFRMSNLHAAVGYAQLRRLHDLNQRRRRVAAEYDRRLQSLPVELPITADDCEHVYQMYTICVDERIRDGLVAELRAAGVMATVHFDPPVHLQSFYRERANGICLPATERLARRILSLPIYPSMTGDDIAYVCETLDRCMDTLRR
jgi:perosamine synthetase